MVAVLLAGCGDGGEGREEPLPWHVIKVKSAHQVWISGSVPFCEGEPEPTISETKVQYEGKNVYIGLTVDLPPEPTGEYLCAGSGRIVNATLRLQRKVSDSVLFDLSEDPPAQRWPEP